MEKKKRREEDPWWKRPLGRHWPIMWQWAINFVEGGVELVETMSREMREAELDRLRAEVEERYEEENVSSCDKAASTGESLTKLKQHEGPRGWVRDVRRMRKDPEGARRRVALFWFAKKWPKVYLELRFLGRERLCRVVSAFDRVYAALVEERPDGTLRERNLTQEEVRERVDPVLRPQRRSPYALAVQRADTLECSVQKLKREHLPPDGGVRELSAKLTAASAHLAGLSTGGL